MPAVLAKQRGRQAGLALPIFGHILMNLPILSLKIMSAGKSTKGQNFCRLLARLSFPQECSFCWAKMCQIYFRPGLHP